MEVSDVRRRLRGAIENARRRGQERRARSEAAAREFETFLPQVAVPVFHTAASALAAEGYRFTVATPAESVRLASETRPEDYLELVLDPGDPPQVLGRVSRGRGRRHVSSERPLDPAKTPGELTEDDVLAFLVAEIEPFVER